MAEVSAKSVSAAAPTDNIPAKPALHKMSFASVAARAATQKPAKPIAATKAVENRPPVSLNPAKETTAMSQAEKNTINVLQESVTRLNVAVQADTESIEAPGPIIASADTDLEQPQPVSAVLPNDDAKTHLSFVSNPTMSADVRSIVSGPAFNMDEKESIRPDESASVKGADESDSVSGQGSGGPQSQVTSEAGKDVFRDQFQEVSSAKKALPLTTSLVGRVPEDTNRNPIPPIMDFRPQGPDEKLLDALENPKDRLFLLQLEQQVIAFISTSKEQVLSLPRQNSFCRLLAHRLGDYYSLSHTADTNLGSVNLGKTEMTRLPPSLKDIASPQTPDSGVPQQQPALKIMRRKAASYAKNTDGGIETVESSVTQSQAGSDTGASGTDQQQSPSKAGKGTLTREEREAQYQAARDRIFGDLEETKPSTETSTAASRASSTTGGKPKKQKNRPKNDDFEPRSMFTTMAYQQQQQQAGYGYGDRQPQQMYGYPPNGGPGMPPHSMAGGFMDGSMHPHPNFHPQQPLQNQQPQMQQQQQMHMGGMMPGYGPSNYPQQPMYNGSYGYSPQGQAIAPIPVQQQYYPGPEQGSPYNNMIAAPMMSNNQQGYGQGYQGWNQSMPMQYSGQDQAGYFPQPPQGNTSTSMMYHGPQKPMDSSTPPAARFSPNDFSMGAAQYAHGHHQQQQQQGQWNQWQTPPQFGQYSGGPSPWQPAQPGMQGLHMPHNTILQQPKMNQYPSQNQNQGRPNKKGGNKGGKGGSSELGKYDTSSLPPKPPAPVQAEQ